MKIGAYGNNLNVTYRINKNSQEDSIDSSKESDSKQKPYKNPNDLDPKEQALVHKLQARDSEVRAHEAAHQAAGAGLAGAASFTYQRGPDGRMYAIGGEVPISLKGGSTPEEKIANARQVAAAALAPANPSPQDYAVASKARMMEMSAQQELFKKKMAENEGKKSYQDNINPQQNTQSVDITA